MNRQQDIFCPHFPGEIVFPLRERRCLCQLGKAHGDHAPQCNTIPSRAVLTGAGAQWGLGENKGFLSVYGGLLHPEATNLLGSTNPRNNYWRKAGGAILKSAWYVFVHASRYRGQHRNPQPNSNARCEPTWKTPSTILSVAPNPMAARYTVRGRAITEHHGLA